MDSLRLVHPDMTHEADVLAYCQEHFDAGEHRLHGTSLLREMPSYADWLEHLRNMAHPDTVRPGWGVSTTLLGVREGDGRVVGIIDIRHTLTEFLRLYGGHIGYGVRPSERRKGYATQMLALALRYARGLGLTSVLVACNADNTASERTILRGGGVLIGKNTDPDGDLTHMFEIDIAALPPYTLS